MERVQGNRRFPVCSGPDQLAWLLYIGCGVTGLGRAEGGARFNGLAGADLGIGDSRGFYATPRDLKDTPTFIPSLEHFSYCPTKATIMLPKYHTKLG